ncbi:MAG: putative baseplate assembly protein [Bryobacteraceae bacterium]|nr:putative baseplate assembly protein [Bryobacteraceae bacterium]
MPIRPPALDDRNFEDLVQELVARIPAHTPEWTNPRLGDPGRTLIELFAWLTDTLLYRVNLIPERQRLAFLRLLGAQMKPAVAARGLVSVKLNEPDATDALVLRSLATISAPAPFETLTELSVLPVTSEAYIKRAPTEKESATFANLVQGLDRLFGLNGAATPYVTTPVFPGGLATPEGQDISKPRSTVDGCLWLALLAPKKDLDKMAAVRATLGQSATGGQQLISIGVMPAIEVPDMFADAGQNSRIEHVWEISTGLPDGAGPSMLRLTQVSDSTSGLTRRGVERLALPASEFIGAPSNDVLDAPDAGFGDKPPRLDDPEKASRLVAWLRLRPTVDLESLALSWAGVNAVEIDQRQTITGRVVGQSNGSADQVMQLPAASVESATFVLQVEDPGRGYEVWTMTDDLATAGRDSKVYTLDSEAGTVQFGDGLRGMIPESTRRVRVAVMRAGGGSAGNVPPGTLTDIKAKNLQNADITRNLKVIQTFATNGGQDAETLVEAERRIPALFRHRDRAVTADDYKRLAPEAPGVRMGRVEVLPRFQPRQRRSEVPGVVSVMVLPFQAARRAPNPRPDRPFLESVHAHLTDRRPLATELYVIGCEYVPLALSAAVTILDGFGQETVLNAVTEALRAYLWPLTPGGTDGAGWRLGRSVRDRELDVAIARVPGIDTVNEVNLFDRTSDNKWKRIPPLTGTGSAEKALELWQLPELLAVVVVAGNSAPTDLDPPSGDGATIGVPVVPEVCSGC